MNDIILQATQGKNRKLTVTVTQRELGNAVIRQATSRLHRMEITVFAHETFVTGVDMEDAVYLSNEDLEPVHLLCHDIRIAALIDAGNTLLHGRPLRPVVTFAEQEAV